MKTAIQEILQNNIQVSPSGLAINGIGKTADVIHQLLCDSMATAMYRCMEHLTAKQQLAKVRLAEYGFSKEEIELSISKLENNDTN